MAPFGNPKPPVHGNVVSHLAIARVTTEELESVLALPPKRLFRATIRLGATCPKSCFLELVGFRPFEKLLKYPSNTTDRLFYVSCSNSILS